MSLELAELRRPYRWATSTGTPRPSAEEVGRVNDARLRLPAGRGARPGDRRAAASSWRSAPTGRASAERWPACCRHVDVGSDCLIVWVATLPEHRGQGLASRLLQAALEEARGRGLRTSSLQASMLGRGVYERLGYRARRCAWRSMSAGSRVSRTCSPPYDDDELDAAIEALTEPERFRSAESLVAAGRAKAPARAGAGARGRAAGSARPTRPRCGRPPSVGDAEERLAALRTLLAEEARMGMMVGVAVGLGTGRGAERDNEGELTRWRSATTGTRLRAERRRRPGPDRSLPEAQQPRRGRDRR